MSSEKDTTRPSRPGTDADISVLDQALWAQFREDSSLADFAQVWLSLQMRQIGKTSSAVVLVENKADGSLQPLATWPPDTAPTEALKQAVEASVERRKGVAFNGGVAEPILIDGNIAGIVALSPADGAARPQDILAQLRWGKGWLQSVLRREALGEALLDQKKSSVVLDVIGALVDAPSHRAATHSVVNILVRELHCAEVAIGSSTGKRTRLRAISDVSDFKMQTGRSRAVEEAVGEAADQQGTVLYPPRDGMHFMVAVAHKQLAAVAPSGELLTVPIFVGSTVVGGLHLRKLPGEMFSDGELMAAEAVAAAIGPILDEKRRAERGVLRVFWDNSRRHLGMLFGPRNLGRKLAALVFIGLVAFLTFAKGEFRINADSEVEGRVIRTIGAPFDGFVKAEFARAGDVVRQGDVVASLDERDLQIELLRWMNDFGRFEGEYDKALADGDAAAARIADANIQQSRAKAELVQQQLVRANLTAPFDAIVIEGDLSQSIGAAVRRGEELYRLAPLDSYRVALEVDETNLDEIKVGQVGQLRLAALPARTFDVEVMRITPRLEAGDGRNFALVEARVIGDSSSIRPGMRGIAKVAVEERLLVDIYSRPILDWLRLKLWRWMP